MLTQIIFWATENVKTKKINILNHVVVGFCIRYLRLVFMFFLSYKWVEKSEKKWIKGEKKNQEQNRWVSRFGPSEMTWNVYIHTADCASYTIIMQMYDLFLFLCFNASFVRGGCEGMRFSKYPPIYVLKYLPWGPWVNCIKRICRAV